MAPSFKLPGTSINFAFVNIFCLVFLTFSTIHPQTVEVTTLGTACTDNNQCNDLNQTCSDGVNGTCVCQNGFVADSSACRLPGYEETCVIDCDTGYVCIENRGSKTCRCAPSNYYDTSSNTCETRKDYDASCGSIQNECKGTLSCQSGKCGCPSEQYRDGSQCFARKDYDASCGSIQNECKGTLSCQSGKCGCPSEQYSDGSQCFARKGYEESCVGYYALECLGTDIKCISYTGGSRRCLCKEDYFRTGNTKQCRSKHFLQVENPSVTTRTTNDVTFTWSTNIYGRSVTYRLASVPTGASQTATANGGSVSGLVSGRRYTFGVESILPGEGYYPHMSTSVILNAVWTKPSKPGHIDLSASQVKTNPMIFVFQQSNGDVNTYMVKLKLGNTVVSTHTVSTNSVEGLNLTPGKTYSYEIIAVNGNRDMSDQTTGTFKTNSAASSAVGSFKITPITSSSVDLQWKPPTSPNGEINAFLVQVFKGSSCLTAYILPCSDCSNNEVPTVPECEQTISGNGFFEAQVDDNNHVFVQNVTSLEAFTEYTLKVFPNNEKGLGAVANKAVTTSDAAPEDLAELNVTSVRDESNGKVGLNVQWIPGKKTGLTNYEVTVVNTDNVVSSKQILIGYDSTSATFPALLAFHDYTVSVVAETRLGTSNPISKDIKTKTTTPGGVQDFKIIPDQTYAKKMKLEFSCPLESERNGIIEGFIVKRQSQSDGQVENYKVDDPKCNEIITVESSKFGDFAIKENYTFEVIAKNQDYESSPSVPLNFYVAPKAPVFQQRVLVKGSNDVSSENSVSVSLCSSCITDENQGEVTNAGLIVCLKSPTQSCSTNRKKRAAMDIANFLSYQTWADAKASDFNSPYRATPDNWIKFLKTDNPPSYVIGNDPSCSKVASSNKYCNGPLPSGKEVVVRVIACTEAGCSEDDFYITVSTKAADSSDSNVGIIVGIIVPVIIIIIAVIAVIVFVRMRRRRKESPGHVEFENITDRERRPIKIRDFSDRVAILHKDSNLMFQGEFEDIRNISGEFPYDCEEARSESNRVKNRYVDILPYDHSRVKLGYSSDGEEGADFINANFIPGLNSKREYIATQGPMHATIPHFWRMVWEQKSKVIVMLSDLMEKNKPKVSLYWPENINEPIGYGDVVVEMTNFSQLNKYIIRNFKLTVGSMTHRVTHFFIPGWEDFNANLSFSDVLEFVQLVRKETTPPGSGPPIVHCSAGVGRTGTYIALDYFMQFIDINSLDDEIDVFNYVLQMRKSRPRMVQAETQYVFIFDALLEVIKRKIKSEQEHLYDNCRSVEENVYANQMVTDHVYANAATIEDGKPSKDTTTMDFTYANEAFEPDDGFASVDLTSNDKPTTVL